MLFLRLRLQHLKSEIIRGWYEVPYLYFTMGLIAISAFGISYKLSTIPKIPELRHRYKYSYIVVRPNDARVHLYPRHYLTDVDVLDKYNQQKEQQEAQK